MHQHQQQVGWCQAFITKHLIVWQRYPPESFVPACREFSTMSLEFVFVFYLCLALFSVVIFHTAMYCTSLPSLTTTTSSAGVFDILAKYFNIFTTFRTRYEYLNMANHISCRTVWSCHQIRWLVYMFNSISLNFQDGDSC